jgi:hypothetical protein
VKSEAPPLPLRAPQITLLDDSSAADERILRLRLASARQPSTLWVSVQNVTILRATIDGKKAPSKMVEPRDKLWGFYYAAPPAQGIELTIAVNPSKQTANHSDGSNEWSARGSRISQQAKNARPDATELFPRI